MATHSLGHGIWDTHLSPTTDLVAATKTRMVGKRSVRIILECFLVFIVIFKQFSIKDSQDVGQGPSLYGMGAGAPFPGRGNVGSAADCCHSDM